MFCNKCGNQLEDGAKFCAYCGSRVEAFNEAENNTEKAQEKSINTLEISKKEKKKSKGKVFALVAVAAVVLIAAAAVFAIGILPDKQDVPAADEIQEVEKTPDFVMYNTEKELYLKYTDTGYVQALAEGEALRNSDGNYMARSSEWLSYYDNESGYLFYPGTAISGKYAADIYRIKPDSEKAQAGQLEPIKVARAVSYDGYTVCGGGEKVYYISAIDNILYCNTNGEDKAVCEDVEAIFICEESNTYMFAKKADDRNAKLYRFDPETYEYEFMFTFENDMDIESGFIHNRDYTVLVYSDGSDVWALFDGQEKKKVTSLGNDGRLVNNYYNHLDGYDFTQANGCVYVAVSKSLEIPYSDIVVDDIGDGDTYEGISSAVLRNLINSNTYEVYDYTLYSVAGKEIKLLSDDAEYVQIHKDIAFYRERTEDRTAKLSEVVGLMNGKFSGSLSSDIKYCFRSAVNHIVYNSGNVMKIAVNGVVNETEHSGRGYEVLYDDKNGLLYYSVESEDLHSYVESWYKCSVKDNRIVSSESLGDDIYTLWLSDSGDYISLKNIQFSEYSELSKADLYINGNYVDSNVNYFYYTYESDIRMTDGVLLYLKNYDEEDFCGTLMLYDGTQSRVVAERVGSHFVQDASNIYYITDYNGYNASGDVMHYDGKETTTAVISDGCNVFIPQ